MQLALELAAKASQQGDVPVGAIVLNSQGDIVGRGFNTREVDNDPMNHAEIVAMREAAITNNSWRLDDHTLVVTLEPCTMCAGALVSSRITKVVFGAADLKAGAFGSLYNIATDPRLSHHPDVVHGVMATECATMLSDLFKNLRETKTN